MLQFYNNKYLDTNARIHTPMVLVVNLLITLFKSIYCLYARILFRIGMNFFRSTFFNLCFKITSISDHKFYDKFFDEVLSEIRIYEYDT